MVEKENKKVEVGKEERKEEGGNGKKRLIETVNLFTNNGMLSFSVWEGGSISVRVSKRGENDDYINVWSGRISPVDFISQFGDLKALAKTAQDELKKVLGTEI